MKWAIIAIGVITLFNLVISIWSIWIFTVSSQVIQEFKVWIDDVEKRLGRLQ